MTFALVTAFFLSIAWLSIVALADLLERKGRRIADALSGRAPQPILPVSARLSARYPARRTTRAVMQPRLRAAA